MWNTAKDRLKGFNGRKSRVKTLKGPIFFSVDTTNMMYDLQNLYCTKNAMLLLIQQQSCFMTEKSFSIRTSYQEIRLASIFFTAQDPPYFAHYFIAAHPYIFHGFAEMITHSKPAKIWLMKQIFPTISSYNRNPNYHKSPAHKETIHCSSFCTVPSQ